MNENNRSNGSTGSTDSTELINNNVKESIINKGAEILSENDFFYNLDVIMSDEIFRNFYNKYFKDFSDIKTVFLYMKLYETIQLEYREINKCEIEKEMLAYMMKELMIKDNTRKKIIESFNNYSENKNSNDKKFILDIFTKKNTDKKYSFILLE